MKPEIGDKVLVDGWSGQKEGIVFRLPTETVKEYYMGQENGLVIYAEESKITILFRHEYHYVNQNPFKVGDLVTWAGERCLVVGLSGATEHNYLISRLAHGGDLHVAREQDLVLVHAAGHPEEKPEVPEVEPEGWYGYPEEAPAVPTFTEVADDVLPF
ncbi:MAG: hypothetical protein A2Y38_03325 [Spirochaetes bacterium GWB1_59_5]|nr:MAG: hypothetical protein A2Y38_03325 [Spirochaetes bacterium GWB1_59_5]